MRRGEASITHGHKRHHRRTRVYVCWMNMRARCDNPKHRSYPNYGGRGIAYCEPWREFAAFLADMGEPAAGETLDRIDNEKGYFPENCRWATRAVQGLNKRNCVRYEWNGVARTLAEWSRETGIGRVTMLKRLQRGWSVARALTEAPAY